MRLHQLTINTDGACSGNPGPAGCAYVVTDQAHVVIASSAVHIGPTGTNQIAELCGAIAGLDYIAEAITCDKYNPIDLDVTVRADSEYVVRGMSEWINGWKTNGWRNASKKPVANVEFWQHLDSLVARLRNAGAQVRFEWIRGHNGDKMNEMCDALAVSACRPGTGKLDISAIMKTRNIGAPNAAASVTPATPSHPPIASDDVTGLLLALHDAVNSDRGVIPPSAQSFIILAAQTAARRDAI